MSTLTLVTGTGRSGTSTMAGALHYLGLDVPGPLHEANESNPKGFFESAWAMDFHMRILTSVDVSEVDSRPSAHARVRGAIGPDLREELTVFLARLDDLEQVVVKDPRTIWTQWLWAEVAESLGREIRFLSMLRHPAEVVSSRTTHYNQDRSPANDRRFQTMNLARWINNSLTNERETRGGTRAFVRYVDLLADWRPVAVRLAEQFGLTYSVDVTGGEHCAVDDWIEPGLRRHDQSWDDLAVPERLVEIAEGVWSEVNQLADAVGDETDASARLDDLDAAFTELMTDAIDMAQDQVRAARHWGRARGRRDVLEGAEGAEGEETEETDLAPHEPDPSLWGDRTSASVGAGTPERAVGPTQSDSDDS